MNEKKRKKSLDKQNPESKPRTKKRKETAKDRMLKLNSFYSNGNFGIWIQCTNCNKWRNVMEYEEDHEVPQNWTCSMSLSGSRNCDEPENTENTVFSPVNFIPGTIVWAKYKGYPWWPGMIEDDPNIEEYYWQDDNGKWHYNVTFLDDKVTRAWVAASSVRSFFDRPKQSKHLSASYAKYSRLLAEAENKAETAINMTVQERLEKFSFAHQFKGKWGSPLPSDDSDDSDEDEKEENGKNLTQILLEEINDIESIHSADSGVGKIDKIMKMKFLMFENEKNLCWLDASIALVAHNKTFKKIVEKSSESQINKIISAYEKATNIFNDGDQNKSETQKILFDIQSSTLKYLKQFLKFKSGEPDSAHCALLNLIYQDTSKIKEYLNVSWIWRKQCSNCGVNSKSATCLKPIITLSKVDTFHPDCPSSLYVCSCKSEQEMKLIYKELPPCLIFHFENGVSTGTNFPLNFSIKDREYQTTGIIILEKGSDANLNHFVTWIRNPDLNIWLECNDLNVGFTTFSPVKPEYDLKDVYIVVYEAFDNLGRINNDDNELSVDQEDEVENTSVELIDLSDEEGDGEKADSSVKHYNISIPDVSVCDPKFISKVPLHGHKIETKSEEFDSQHKADDEFIESMEFKSETVDYEDNNASKDSIVNKDEIFSNPLVSSKIFTVQNFETNSKEKSKDNEECISTSQTISVSNFNLPKEISLIKHETKAEFDNFGCQNESFVDFPKSEATDNQKHEVMDTSDETGNISIPLNSACVAESITAGNTSYEDPVFGKKSVQNDSTSDARENEADRSEENELQLKMKQICLNKEEKNKFNEKKRGKVDDGFSSNKRNEEIDKFVSSDKGKNVGIMNDQCAGISSASNEISENICQSSKSTSMPKDVDSHKNKSKVSGNTSVKVEKGSGEFIKQNANVKGKQSKPLSKKQKDQLTNMIDVTVGQTFASFFKTATHQRDKK